MDLNLLEKYYNEGWLIKQNHPVLDLTIWNYSQSTQYERYWDKITKMCRGLVTNQKGDIVARPFKKFFNIEENRHNPTIDYDVYKKMDGSLGIAFYYKREWVFATRGSFTSEQAIKGKEMFRKYFKPLPIPKGKTYLFEIIYPENRIVVDYNNTERLVLLGVKDTKTGYEHPLQPFRDRGYDVVDEVKFPLKHFSHLKQKVPENEEGYVIRFRNGDRCKIKSEEYIRLHKIMTELSTKSIWECLLNGEDIYSVLKDVPDEFFGKIKKYKGELEEKYKEIEVRAKNEYNKLKKFENNRAQFAKYAKTSNLSSILFKMLDRKNYTPIIWKMIKPKYEKLV